jgi:2-polyprenyl-3-methyl-5-hydroxy-6-metoxy-1,4-benzoquinol methylase
MPKNVETCPLCGSSLSKFFDRCEFRGKSVTNQICRDCGLVYQSPCMTEAENDDFYADEYRLVYEGSSNPTSRNLMDQQGRADSLYSFTKPIVDSVSRHLDIGCSIGLLLQRFQQAYHCQIFGIEPGSAHRARALKQQLSVYATLNELREHEKDRFDLVSMSHVLEHLPDPVGYLVHLRELFVAPDGWLLLEVPNLYAHDSFEIAHLVSYSSHTLIQTLEKAGYEPVRLEKHGRPRSNLLPLYLTVMARPMSVPSQAWSFRPERLVAVKRRTGMLRRRVLERLLPKQAWT